jgi:hypothetical protein
MVSFLSLRKILPHRSNPAAQAFRSQRTPTRTYALQESELKYAMVRTMVGVRGHVFSRFKMTLLAPIRFAILHVILRYAVLEGRYAGGESFSFLKEPYLD